MSIADSLLPEFDQEMASTRRALERVDEGQLAWLKGYCHPIRFLDLVKNKKVPADVLAKLPPAEAYATAVFPTLEQQNEAKEMITKQWDTVVGANVK